MKKSGQKNPICRLDIIMKTYICNNLIYNMLNVVKKSGKILIVNKMLIVLIFMVVE